jgi:hypothetical protein
MLERVEIPAMRTGHPLLAGIRRVMDVAATVPRRLWLTLRSVTSWVVRPIAEARRENAIRRARYWGTYS